MGRHENGLVNRLRQIMQQLHDLNLTWKIEEGRRFIEEDYRCFLCQRFCDHHLLAFSVAQRMHHALGKCSDIHQLDSFLYRLLVFLLQRTPKTGVRTSSEADQLLGGHVADVALLCQYDTNQRR